MMLGKFPVWGRPTYLDYSRARVYCACSRCGWGCLDIFSRIRVGQGPTALAVGAGGGCLDIFILTILSFLFLPLFGRRPDID